MIPACEDVETISARMREIAAEREPKCPIYSHRPLHECLRSQAKCGPGCPHVDAWIGPETE